MPVLRWPLACPHCHKVVKRHAQHLKKCKKRRSKVPIAESQRAMRTQSIKLLRNSTVDFGKFWRIYKIKSRKERRFALKNHLIEIGHYVSGYNDVSTSDGSSSDEGSAQGESGPATSGAENADAISASDDETDELALTQLLKPIIDDPSADKNYQKDSVLDQIQRASLFRRFSDRCKIFIKFARYKLKKGDSKRIMNQDVNYCGRIMAYVFEKKGVPLEDIDDNNKLVSVLSTKRILSFVKQMEKCNITPETRNSIFRAILGFLDYMKHYGELTQDFYQHVKRMANALKKEQGVARRDVRKLKRKKQADEYKKGKSPGSVKQCRAIFRATNVIRMLEDAKKRVLDRAYGEKVPKDAYTFILRYCVSKVSLGYGRRPQIAENLRVGEWMCRETVETEERTYIKVFIERHKTSATQGADFLHLEEEDNDIFQFYFESCRLKLWPLDEDLDWRESEEPFFVTYSGKPLVNKGSKTIKRFGEAIGSEQFITSTMARHIFQTEAEVRLAHDPRARESLSRNLGHTLTIGRGHYLDPRPEQYIHGAIALSHLERDEDDAFTQTQPLQQVDEPITSTPRFANTPSRQSTAFSEDLPRKRRRLSAVIQESEDDEPPSEEFLMLPSQEQEPPPAVNSEEKAAMKKKKKKKRRLASSNSPVEPLLDNPVEAASSVARITGATASEIDEKRRQYLLKKYLINGVDSEVPTASEISQDPVMNLAEGKWKEGNRFRSWFQEHLNSLRVIKIVDALKTDGQLDCVYDDMNEKDHEKKVISWERFCREYCNNKRWSAINFQRRILAAIKRRLASIAAEERASEDVSAAPVTKTPAPLASERPRRRKRMSDYSDDIISEMIQTQVWPFLSVRENLPGRGRGIYAASKIPKGKVVCDYKASVVQILSHHEKMMQELKDNNRTAEIERIEMYRFQYQNHMGVHKMIDGSGEDGSYGRLINHSPNHSHCNLKPKFRLLHNRDGTNQEAVLFVAKRDIEPNEELLYNYSKLYSDQPWANQCPCSTCLPTE